MTNSSASSTTESKPTVAPSPAGKHTAASKTASAKSKPVAAPSSAPVKARRAAPSKSPQPVQTAKPVKKAKAETPDQTTKNKSVTAPVVKEKKVKVVRDSFTIPKNEFSQLGEMKKKAIGLGLEIKKSELIRAGLLLLNSVGDAAFKKALGNVPTLKTGRPGKN